MKKIFITFIIIVLCNSLFSQILSYPINNEAAITNNKQYPIVYYLPKTNLIIDINVITSYYIPGPFAAFADKYLLIKNVYSNEKTNTYISDIKISEYSIADETNAFIAISDNFKIQLNNLGILSAYNHLTLNENINFQQKNNINETFEDSLTLFTNSIVSSNFYNKTDTTYRVVQVDSVFEKIPVINKNLQSKNLEQKAEEAANFIIKLRNARFQLQSGDFETDIPPTNVNELIEELNSLEKLYLELFIGKNININNNYQFDISPTKEENISLGYLSETNGIISKSEKNAKQINLNIKSLNTCSNLTKIFNQDALKKQPAGLYYRNPEFCSISVSLNNKIISEKKLQIAQLGLINFLPQKLFSNKNLKIIFDTNTGGIKSIFNE